MAEEPENPDITDDLPAADEATEVTEAGEPEGEPAQRRSRWRTRRSNVTTALVASGLAAAALVCTTAWLGYQAHGQREAQAHRDLFVRIARQGAVNLTTLDYTQIDNDVQRILDSATGVFRAEFEQRSKPFIELVKTAQSKSEGTVTDAGLESEHGDSAQVLVAVAVKSRTAAGEEAPREWRMRIEVKSVDDGAKISNVVFVP